MASLPGFGRRRLLASCTALLWRRASTFCKAPLKKSSFHRLVSQHPLQLVDLLIGASRLARVLWRRLLTVVEGIKLIAPLVQQPPMYAKFLPTSATMLSQVFNRSTAIRRNSFGYRPTRLFATRSAFPCKVCQLRVSQFKGSVQKTGPEWANPSTITYALLNRSHEPTVLKQRTTTPCITKVTWDSVSPCYTVVASNTTVVVVALVCT